MKKLTKLYAAMTVMLVLLAVMSSCMLFAQTNSSCAHSQVNEGDCQTLPTCKSCSEVVGDYGPHDYLVETVPATCLTDGYTEHECKICGDYFADGTIPATGHSFGEWVITKEPTDTDSGEIERECSSCGVTESDEIPPHVHDIAYIGERAATCTAPGYAAYEYCTLCVYTTRVDTPALGHDYGAYESLGGGEHARTCANDSSHILIEPCSSGSGSGGEHICIFCGAEYSFASREGNSSYGYYAFGEYANADKLQLLYEAMIEDSEAFLLSTDNLIDDEGYYVIGTYDLDTYSLSTSEAMAVWKVFYVSNPAYYWLDSSCVTKGNTLYLTVSSSYASYAYRAQCDAAIAAMAEECAVLIDSDMSELEKAMAILEYIVSNMEYAYESDGVTPADDFWAHNITGLAMYEYGVCESYAKSYLYLCLLNDVECIISTGYSQGVAHAWNYVRIDGIWYGADVTWTDKCGDIAVYDNFGLSADHMSKDHVTHSSSVLSVDFIYETPAVSSESMSISVLYEDGVKVGTYKDIMSALSAIDNPNAEYEIDIAFYSSYRNNIKHVISASVLPEAEKITVKGKSEYVGEGYYDNNSYLYISSSITLSGDLEFKDLYVKNDSMSNVYSVALSAHTLTLSGKSVYLECRITDRTEGSEVICATERGAVFHGGVDIYYLEIVSDKVVFGYDSYVYTAKGSALYTQNGADVTIEHRI